MGRPRNPRKSDRDDFEAVDKAGVDIDECGGGVFDGDLGGFDEG